MIILIFTKYDLTPAIIAYTAALLPSHSRPGRLSLINGIIIILPNNVPKFPKNFLIALATFSGPVYNQQFVDFVRKV